MAGIQGNPAEEETLKEANIQNARALIACLEDSDNAFSIMVAKDLNPSIFTVAVSHTKTGHRNIKRAGADQILAPYSDTAKKARVLLQNPVAAEFSEIVSDIGEIGMLQKISMLNEELEGKTLDDIDLRKKTGAMVIAIEREGKILHPEPDIKFKKEDNLFVLGAEEQLKKASEVFIK